MKEGRALTEGIMLVFVVVPTDTQTKAFQSAMANSTNCVAGLNDATKQGLLFKSLRFIY
jgi:hypothetical protein